jgi:photosystem II stability/assembly factor-like uncharacterized protein
MKHSMIPALAVFLSILGTCTPAAAQGWSQALPTNTSQGLNGVFSVSSSLTIAVGNSGTIVGTTDGGNTWNTGNSGTTENLRKVFVSGLSLPVITTVGDNGTILRSTNAGVTWLPWYSGVTVDLMDLFVQDPLVGNNLTIVGETGVILFSSNGGSSWGPRMSPTSKTLNGVFFKTLLDGYAVGDDATVISTTNGGASWQFVTIASTAKLNHVFFTTLSKGWIVGNGGLILNTTDGGATWSPVANPTSENLRRVMFTDSLSGTVVGDNGVVLRTVDGGVTWYEQITGTTFDLYSVFFIDTNYGMVAGERGLVIATINGGWPVELRAFTAVAEADGSVDLRWETETETQNFGFDIERDAGSGWETVGFVPGNGDSRMKHGYAFTDHPAFEAGPLRYRLRQRDYDGRWEYSPVVTVERNFSAASVTLAVWPNPFNPSTNLQVTLPRTAAVRLRIHDIQGRLRATVYEGSLSAGVHLLPWNAVDAGGGRYFAVLETDGVRRVMDLIFLK